MRWSTVGSLDVELGVEWAAASLRSRRLVLLTFARSLLMRGESERRLWTKFELLLISSGRVDLLSPDGDVAVVIPVRLVGRERQQMFWDIARLQFTKSIDIQCNVRICRNKREKLLSYIEIYSSHMEQEYFARVLILYHKMSFYSPQTQFHKMISARDNKIWLYIYLSDMWILDITQGNLLVTLVGSCL